MDRREFIASAAAAAVSSRVYARPFGGVAGGSSGLTVTTNTLTNAVVGTAYTGPLASTGGAGSNLWNLESCLPNVDLCFAVVTNADGSGQVQGTPTQAGTYTLVVQVGDSASANAQKTLTLTVTD